MSLWTPDGEVPLERGGSRSGPPAPPPEVVRTAAEAMGIDPASLSPEEQARLVELVAQMAEAQQRLAAASAADVVANHAMGLYEFAAIKLGAEPPMLEDARAAIDALGALVETVGDRLGEHADPLTDALASIRMAWVSRSEPGTSDDGNPGD